MNTLKALYQKAKDHLTKFLGALGAAVSAVAAIDPEPIRAAAQSYLGPSPYAKVAAVLFGLVILRGWWTGQHHDKVCKQ